jgi:hypothetical protein
MKKRLFNSLLGMACLIGLPLRAQQLVPYSFHYAAQPPESDQLKILREVAYPATSSLRLYFKGTQLGETSYLLLEAIDGGQQEIRQPDLENWQYSSAYFNGNRVKVSLYAAAGETNVVEISQIKVNDGQAEPASSASTASGTLQAPVQTGATTSATLTDTYPYAKAVGRFTNGSSSYGTGWIAPNGAIVTSFDIYYNYIAGKSYDVIEFNVPPSDGTTVKHPSPQDQYPLGKFISNNRSFGFKDGDDIFTAHWAILEALPNSTGLRPGERQQQFLRIATNPSNFTIDAMGNIPVELFHYGQLPGDSYSGQFRTLRVLQTSLLKQYSFISSIWGESRNMFVLYNATSLLGFNQDRFLGSDAGAPITYQGSNFAIGVHLFSLRDLPSYGMGFKDDVLRNGLKNFFSSKSVYVDSDGLYDPATGEIHKPYLSIQHAASAAPNGAQVYIAKDTYYGAVTFNRPMTLRAPVGKVIIGVPYGSARIAVNAALPSELLMEETLAFDRKEELAEPVGERRAYPNPFRDQTMIQYELLEKSPVTVRVLDHIGTEIATLVEAIEEAGTHTLLWNGTNRRGVSLPPGVYIVQLRLGHQTSALKLIKQ